MRGPLTPGEFAERVGLPVDRLEEYRASGLLDPEEDGHFDDFDILRLAMLRPFEDQGLDAKEIAAELDKEEHSLIKRIFTRGKATYTLETASQEMGVTPAQIEEVALALGFPIDSPLDASDIESFRAAKTLLDLGLPWESVVEGARVYADALRRIAKAEISMTHRFLCERMAAEGADDKDVMVAFYQAGPQLMEMSGKLIDHMHEDYLLEALADHAVDHLETAASGKLRGAEETSVLFVDLALFTPLAQAHGDETAAEVLDRFDNLVRKHAVSHGGTIVKQIGDAFMLTFSDTADAVRFSVEVMEAANREIDFPALRIGINAGPVLYRVGDYIGNTVNVASRMMAMAMPNVILMTLPVAEAARSAGIGVEDVGVRRVRGAEEPIEIYRVTTTTEAHLDPVCGMLVRDDPAAKLIHNGREFFFCSHDCAKQFLDDPGRYAPAAS